MTRLLLICITFVSNLSVLNAKTTPHLPTSVTNSYFVKNKISGDFNPFLPLIQAEIPQQLALLTANDPVIFSTRIASPQVTFGKKAVQSVTELQLLTVGNKVLYQVRGGCNGDNIDIREMAQGDTTTNKWRTWVAMDDSGSYYANSKFGYQIESEKVALLKATPVLDISASQTSACSGELVSFTAKGCYNGVITWRRNVSTYLSDLNPTKQRGTFKKDISIDNTPLTIDGKEYKRGIGVHAYSYLKYKLHKKYRTFRVTIGRDDEQDACCGVSTVRFKVVVNGKEKYNQVKGTNDPAEDLEIDVYQKTTLELYVYPEDQDWGDNADWANARLEPNSGGEEVKNGKMVDFFGPGTYEAYCVTAGISSSASTVSILPCNTNAPVIEVSKTRVRPTETFTLSVKGSPSFTRVIQGSITQHYKNSELPATIKGPAKIEVGWSNDLVTKEVFLSENTGLLLYATKYKAATDEPVNIFAVGCDYGQVEWKIGNLPTTSYGYTKIVAGAGYYEARCVPTTSGGKPDLYTNPDWVLINIKPTTNVEPLVTAPTNMCPNVNTTLTASNCPSGYGYQWKTLENGWENFGDSTVIRQPQEIEVRCLKNDRSFSYPSKKVQIFSAFPADFKATNNSPVLKRSNLKLAATFVEGATYQWTGPNGYSSGEPSSINRIVTISSVSEAIIGNYTLTTTWNSCSQTVTMPIKINDCDFNIKARDPISGESCYTLYPNPSKLEEYKPLVLVIEAKDRSPLNNYDFNWTTTAGINITDPHAQSIKVIKGGVYKVRVSPTDNPSVGCVSTVNIDRRNLLQECWEYAKNITIDSTFRVKSIPITSNDTYLVATYRKAGAPEITNLPNIEKYKIETRLLKYIDPTSGKPTNDYFYLIPITSYWTTHTTINPLDFTGYAVAFNKDNGEYQGGFYYENGAYKRKFKIWDSTLNAKPMPPCGFINIYVKNPIPIYFRNCDGCKDSEIVLYKSIPIFDCGDNSEPNYQGIVPGVGANGYEGNTSFPMNSNTQNSVLVEQALSPKYGTTHTNSQSVFKDGVAGILSTFSNNMINTNKLTMDELDILTYLIEASIRYKFPDIASCISCPLRNQLALSALHNENFEQAADYLVLFCNSMLIDNLQASNVELIQ